MISKEWPLITHKMNKTITNTKYPSLSTYYTPSPVLRRFTHTVLHTCTHINTNLQGKLYLPRKDRKTKVLALSDLLMATQLLRRRAKSRVQTRLVPQLARSFHYTALPCQSSIQYLLRPPSEIRHLELSIAYFFYM